MKQKICYFNRSSVHYRKNIYLLLDKELGVEFYFGDSRPGNIAPFDSSLLSHPAHILHNINIGSVYWQKGLVRLLWSNYTDFISPCDTHSLTSWIFLFLSRLLKKNVYLWTHGAYGNEGFLKKQMRLLQIRAAKGAFLYGQYAKDILIKWGVSPNKLHVIYNSLDYDTQLEVRKEMKLTDVFSTHFQNDNKNLIFIGRLTKVKKLHQVLLAIAELAKQGEFYNITFIGDGSEMQTLSDLTIELNLQKNVWFYGSCYDEKQISEFIYNADLCVSPGNVGLTAMHAMVFGTPVISHDNFPMQMPEFEAIIEGKTGAFFKEDSIKSLAQAIQRWYSYQIDREKIRENCFSVIYEKYNPYKQIETFKKVILK